MEYYKVAEYNLKSKLVFKNHVIYDDNIYTFDIESTSIMYNPKTGAYELYDKTKEPEYYDTWEKYGYMYIWQFGINDTVVYGRTWEEFIELLTVLKKLFIGRKFIYVFNLAFEFQFFKHLFNDLTIFARANHKVIYARSDEFNIEFRCALFLTNMRLEKLAENYNLPITKMSGDLDYDKIRHNKTKLTKKELRYCEYDCLVVYELIKKKREEYRTVHNIPLTQTGELRRVCQKMYRDDFQYKSWLHSQLINDVSLLQWCLMAFMGGYTHACASYANRIMYDIASYDIASSYPYAETAEQYPVSIPFECNTNYTVDDIINDDKCLFIVEITLKDIHAKYLNNIISESKCSNKYNVRVDNGRVRSADSIDIVVTSIDLKCIFDFYDVRGGYEFRRVVGFFKGYLDKKFIDLIWTLYTDKTALKGIEEQTDNYNKQKRYINACYGMTCTNYITDDVVFNTVSHMWEEPKRLTPETAQEKLNKLNAKKDTFLSPIWGIFCTAYARRNLYSCMLEIEKRAEQNGYNCGVVYCDTDSIKCFGDVSDIFEEYNKQTDFKLHKTATTLGLDYMKTRPQTVKGERKPLGHFCYEETYKEFKTLGAKKYLVKDDKNKLHLTLAGVSKTGVKALKSLDEFERGFTFGYDHSGKKLLYYGENQPDIEVVDCYGVKGTLTGVNGVCLTPCRYSLGITPEYFEYLGEFGNDANTLHGLMELSFERGNE